MTKSQTQFLIVFLLFTGIFNVKGQTDRPSEERVETEKIFIDASREKVLGNYENATFLFKEVLKRDKKNHAAAYELARLYDVLDEVDKALASIKMAIDGDAENPWYRMFLADIYDRQENPKSGAKIFEELVKKEPYNQYYYFKWAYLLMKAGDAEKAIEVYSTLEQKIGITEEVSRKKHQLLLGLGRMEEAAQTYQLLIKSDPYNLEYLHLLANFYIQIKDQDAANQIYQRILEIDPNDSKASVNRVSESVAVGDDVAYLQSLEDVFDNPKVDIDLKIKKILPYIQRAVEKPDDPIMQATLKLAQLLEKNHPQDAKSYSVYGDLLYHSQRRSEALEKYKKAITLNNAVYSIYEQLMYIYVESEDYDDLLSIATEAIDLFPNQASAFYLNGLGLSKTGKDKEAVSVLQQGLLMSRKNPRLQFEIYTELASVYHRLKNYKLSSANYEKALALNPKDYKVLNNYSYHLAERETDLEKAKSMAALANELSPNNYQLQDTYGWILYKMREFESASVWFKKAVANGGSSSPKVLEHLGDVYFQLGNIEQALLEWKKAQDLNEVKDPNLEEKIRNKQL